MPFRFSTAVQLMHRPHLITANAAADIATRLRAVDPHLFERTSRFDALMRRVGLGGKGKPRAMDDDEPRYVAPTRPAAYVPAWMGEPDDELEWGASVKDGVALLEIRGPLAERGEYFCGEWFHGYDTIAAAIAEMDAHRDVKGILVRFDTPGGVVASGIYDLAASLQARGADAKPLWAHCEMACSAGYWIASQFDRVLAPKAGLIGSIGAVMVHESYAGALEKAGIAVEAIQFGASKTDGAWWKALSDVARADLQAMIDEIGGAFCDTVATGRAGKLSAEQARATEARVFSASHSDKSRDALALGLIDGVMSERESFEALKAEVSAVSAFPIPAKAGATAAPAAQTPAKAGTTTETSMTKREQRVAAVMAGKTSAKTSDEKIAEIEKILADEGEETEAEGDEEKPEAEGDEEKPEAEEEEDKADASAAAKKPNAATVLAILDLPEAKGREAQARKLAETPGMTVATAKGILAAGPKPSRLADRVTDPKISADGGKKLTDEQQLEDAGFAAAGVKPKARRG